jgi:hypothetical protein
MDVTPSMTQVPLWRKLAAGVLGVSGSIALVIEAKQEAWKVGIPILALIAAALVVHRPTLGPQLLARAIWWSNLGLGAILCFVGGSSERRAGIVLTWGCGLALLAISRKGLAEASERADYAPAAFRSSLLLLMVLALADAQTLLVFAMVEASRNVLESAVMGFAGLVFLAGFVGLYKIRIWGALLNTLTAILLLALIGTTFVKPSHSIGPVILVLATVHTLAAAPMLLSVFAKLRLPSAPATARGLLTSIAVVLVMGTSMYFAFRRQLL